MLNVYLNRQFVILYAETAFEVLGRILSLTWWSVKHSAWCYVHIRTVCMHTAVDLRTPFACCQHSTTVAHPYTLLSHKQTILFTPELYVLYSTHGAYNSLSPTFSMSQDQLREVVAHVKRVQQKQQESMGKVQQIADSVAEQKRALEAQQEVFEA